MDDRIRVRQPLGLVLVGMAAVFAGLGVFFVALPVAGGAFFGLPVHGPEGTFYVRAIGFRDFAVALYLLLLTLGGNRRAVFLLLVGTLVIPAGDLLQIGLTRGADVHLLPHLFSAICFATVAWWVRRSATRLLPPGDPIRY